MKHISEKVNVPLLSSVVVTLVLIIGILYTVATRENEGSKDQPYEVIEVTEATVGDTQEVIEPQPVQTVENVVETEAQVIYTEDGVVSISDDNNDIYIQGDGNVNVEVNGELVVSADGDTDYTQDGNVNVGNVGNGNVQINVN